MYFWGNKSVPQAVRDSEKTDPIKTKFEVAQVVIYFSAVMINSVANAITGPEWWSLVASGAFLALISIGNKSYLLEARQRQRALMREIRESLESRVTTQRNLNLAPAGMVRGGVVRGVRHAVNPAILRGGEEVRPGNMMWYEESQETESAFALFDLSEGDGLMLAVPYLLRVRHIGPHGDHPGNTDIPIADPRNPQTASTILRHGGSEVARKYVEWMAQNLRPDRIPPELEQPSTPAEPLKRRPIRIRRSDGEK